MAPLRHALRRLARAPVFTSVAIATLALGIGANTAIFSVVNGVLIRPLSYPRAQELVGVWHLAPGIAGIAGNINCSPTMYFTYAGANHTFQDFGLWSRGGESVTGLAEPEQVQALYFTYGIFQALAIQPAVGRWFSSAEDAPGSPDVVVLSYGYWQRRFGGDASAIGRSLTVDARPRTVIGVMPRDFRFMDSKAELVLPLRFDRNKIFLGNFSYQGLARLKPGVTLQQANADVARMLPIWLKAWPAPPGFSPALFESAHFAPRIQPLKQELVGDIGAMLWVLMGTIGMVLLIACANVANLLLVRAESRQQELAIRAALGAGWGRIARELLLESVTLGAIGGALGLALAYGALRLLIAKGPATLPRLNEIGIDPTVLAFTAAVSLLAGLLFGLIPVLKYAGPRLTTGLRGGGRTLTQGRERHRARNVLVVVQVGMALVLLVGSGLMIRTFQALRDVRPGFTRPEQIQMLRVSIPEAHVKEHERVMRMQQEMLDKLAAIPGVSSAAFANCAPLEDFNSNDVLYAQDRNYAVGEIPPIRRFRFISPGFFKATGTPLVTGRDFTWTDLYEKRHVALVSENLAREMWGDPRAALGKRIREGAADPWNEIIGVAGDVYDDGVQQKVPAFVYWPAMTDTFWGDRIHVIRSGTFVIRTTRAGTESFLAEARRAVWSVDANLPVYLVRTLQEVFDRSMARTSFTLVLLAIAGVMALLLGVIGIYGVIAYAVEQRTREIGIRIALGAPPGGLQRMFVRQGLLLASIGAVLGLGAAGGMTRWMKSLLFGISALDPATYALVAAILIAAAALASYLPARRATAVDPLETLRAE
ncbi:MAG TPA: ABC transporter permease [Candidatus Acidoferrales bacterium]|nr:ABC transporter permease [Candidatus Acidoferrales bacterium]